MEHKSLSNIFRELKASVAFDLCLWSSSLQPRSGLACWLTTQDSPSKTLSLCPCCSMSNGKLFT